MIKLNLELLNLCNIDTVDRVSVGVRGWSRVALHKLEKGGEG